MKTKSMKTRMLTLATVLGLATCGTEIANANILSNPDLDIVGTAGANGQANPGPVQWNIEADTTLGGSFSDGADSETFDNYAQPGGYGVFFKPFQGSTNANPALNNGLNVNLYQDNPIGPGTACTLTAWASCGGDYSGFLYAPKTTQFLAIDFLDAGNTVIASTLNPLAGLPGTGAGGFAQYTVVATAPAGTTTVRCRAAMTNGFNTYIGDQSLNFDSFDLEITPPAGSPAINSQPGATTVATGGNTSLTVGATGALTYQWQLEGTPVVNGVNGVGGQGTATLTITGASINNVGHYRAVLSNGSGTVYSSTAPLALNGINFFPTVNLTGKIGDTYAVERSSTVNGTYTPFSTNKLTVQPQYIVDYTLPVSPNEFYKEVFLY